MTMRKTRLLANIAFMALILASCSFGGQGSESSSAASGSLSLSSVESDSASSEEHISLSSRSGRPSSSSYERNPFSIKSSSDHYTVSIYQSYYLRRGDDGEPVYGNPRYDYSISVEANQRLYSTMDELNELLNSCNESYHPNGGAYGVYGFYFDETCQRSIGSMFKVTSDMRAYYYCKG